MKGHNKASEQSEPTVVDSSDEASRPSRRSARPAETIPSGNVKARIWANHTSWGDIDWKVDFGRVYARRDGNGVAQSFGYRDLQDVMRCAYRAQCWIKKAEKRLNRRRFWPAFLGF